MSDELPVPTGDEDDGKDPIVDRSFGGPLLFWALILTIVTLWAVWDETYTKRPWKDYQATWIETYAKVLANIEKDTRVREEEVRSREVFQAKVAQAKAEAERVADAVGELQGTISWLNRAIGALDAAIKYPKAEIDARAYRVELVHGDARKARQASLADFKKGPFPVEIPARDDGSAPESLSLTFDAMLAKVAQLRERKAIASKRLAGLSQPGSEIRASQDAYLADHLPHLTAAQVAGIRAGLDGFVTEIKQVHVADVDLIERCTSCHLGTLAPVPITRKELFDAGLRASGEKLDAPETHDAWFAKMRAAFVSHPRPDVTSREPDLLAIHDPNRFGCSPCHGGNGIGLTSAHLAHGKNKHWPWPLFDIENVEAGCNQCHEEEIVLEGAHTLNLGKSLFYKRGCWACHKREGFDAEAESLKINRLARREAETERRALDKKLRELNAIYDDEDLPAERIPEILARINEVQLAQSGVDTNLEVLRVRQRDLQFEHKKPGPNLKEIRAKLKPEWLAAWIRDPRAFRPDTKMPVFRFMTEDDEVDERRIRAIAAFLWQSALDVEIPVQAKGDAVRGEELFKSRGCLGCHSVSGGAGGSDPGQGENFAADLSRIGEKVHYDYLVRWIQDPRQRLLPYSPEAGRDITAEDYAKAGKEPIWDRDHTVCPSTGGELVVENMTVMPSLRLGIEESRDIATWLMTLATDHEYPSAEFLGDGALASEGRRWVRHYGCFSCHEIKGLEGEGRIGTELSKWGSKPIERIDFGHLTQEFKRAHKYDRKNFAMQKLAKPEFWDKDRVRTPELKLRMPNFGFDDRERVAVTTFLLGSVDSRFPARFYKQLSGRDRAIADGWWVIKKYNCVGCHEFVPGQKPFIQRLDRYEGDGVVKAPPSLVGQGARTNPEWLGRFLRSPALTEDPARQHRNGVREYLDVRMPNFHLTASEVGKLVAFFDALSRQPQPFVPPHYDALTNEEVNVARAFLDEVCLKCHVAGEITKDTVAPSFVISGQRLKPAWMRRWVLDPQRLIPGTQMPSGLFRADDAGQWVYSKDEKEWPAALKAYDGDHADLLVRYMREFGKHNPVTGN